MIITYVILLFRLVQIELRHAFTILENWYSYLAMYMHMFDIIVTLDPLNNKSTLMH